MSRRSSQYLRLQGVWKRLSAVSSLTCLSLVGPGFAFSGFPSGNRLTIRDHQIRLRVFGNLMYTSQNTVHCRRLDDSRHYRENPSMVLGYALKTVA